MSGVVSVTVRLPDGAITRMLWPTSRLHHLQVPGLPEKDPATLRNLTVVGHGPWRGARPWPSRPGKLSPAEYGLVVVDLARNRIITHQNATDLSSISLGSLTRSARNPQRAAAQREALAQSGRDSFLLCHLDAAADPVAREGEVDVGSASHPWFADADSDAARAAELYARGRLTRLVLTQLNTSAPIQPGRDFGTLLTELREVADRLENHPDPWASILAHVCIDWQPIELIDLANQDDGGERFYELLREGDMQLTRTEERRWHQWGWLPPATSRKARQGH